MSKNNEFKKVIEVLDELNLLDDVIIIGAWAEFLYEETNYLSDFSSSFQTFDIDILIINKNKPREKVNLKDRLYGLGYIIDKDRLTNSTIITTSDGFTIEFLLAKVGAGKESAMETNIGVTAQTLRNLEILKQFTTVINYDGYKIKIPIPEAYVMQKILINNQRKDDKKLKDQERIANIYNKLNSKTFNSILASLSPKQQKIIKEYIHKHLETKFS